MTDKEIIQALGNCKDCSAMEECNECPYVECSTKKGCVVEMLSDALDLINRQQAEIERLKNSGIRANSVEDWLDYCNGLKAEAIKECLDRIEAFLCGVCGSVVEDNPNLDLILFGYNTEEVDAFIDNLRKEMVGEGK